jgi:hypothetical protein
LAFQQEKNFHTGYSWIAKIKQWQTYNGVTDKIQNPLPLLAGETQQIATLYVSHCDSNVIWQCALKPNSDPFLYSHAHVYQEDLGYISGPQPNLAAQHYNQLTIKKRQAKTPIA